MHAYSSQNAFRSSMHIALFGGFAHPRIPCFACAKRCGGFASTRLFLKCVKCNSLNRMEVSGMFKTGKAVICHFCCSLPRKQYTRLPGDTRPLLLILATFPPAILVTFPSSILVTFPLSFVFFFFLSRLSFED